MNVLVTGGAGFVGSHLVESLVDDGHSVTVFDNVSRGARDRLGDVIDDVTFVEGDIRDADALDRAAGDPEVIVHLAAINGTKNFYERPLAVLDVNVIGTQNVVDYARNEDVERLVFASSSEVYGFPEEFPTPESHQLQIMDSENPRYSYAGSKIIGEQYVVNGSSDGAYEYAIVRPHNLYGPDMGYDHVIPEFIERLLKDEDFTIYGDGTQTRSFCYITDAIDAISTLISSPSAANAIYNVGTQHEITINELANHLFEVAGVYPEVEHIESKELSGSPDRRQPDISKATADLDYQPSVSLEEGLRRTLDAYCRDLMGVNIEEWRSS